MARMKRMRRGERKLVTRKQPLHEISSNSRHSSRGDWIIAHHVTALSFHMEIFLPASPNATQEPHSGALAFFASSKRLIDYWPTESFDPLLKI
jgi:hypothetical protein